MAEMPSTIWLAVLYFLPLVCLVILVHAGTCERHSGAPIFGTFDEAKNGEHREQALLPKGEKDCVAVGLRRQGHAQYRRDGNTPTLLTAMNLSTGLLGARSFLRTT